MHFIKGIAAALLFTIAAAESVQHLDKRQLGGLGTILQLVKGVLPDTQGAANGVPSGTAGAMVPAATGTTSGVAVDNSCVDAIAKIDDALQLSESFMKANGGRPTLKDIQVVLKTLENSLSDECKSNTRRRRSSQTQGSDTVVEKEEHDAYLKSIFTANEMKETAFDSGSENAGGRNMVHRRSNNVVRRRERCSDCERALYNIVKELQDIFSIGQAAAEPEATTAAVTNSTTVPV